MMYYQYHLLISILVASTVAGCVGRQERLRSESNPPNDQSTKTDDESDKPSVATKPVGTGVEDGNGGDIIICKKSYPSLGNRSTGSLDLYMARQRFTNIELLNKTNSDTNETAIAKAVAKRLEKLDPHRYRILVGFIDTFYSEAKIDDLFSIPELSDEGAFVLPGADCRIQNIILRKTPKVPGDQLYSIQGKLWKELDTDSRVALILHEVIYREMAWQHRTAEVPIYFNGSLIGDQFRLLDQKGYIEMLGDLGIAAQYVTKGGVLLDLATVSFSASGEVSSGSLAVGDYRSPDGALKNNTDSVWKSGGEFQVGAIRIGALAKLAMTFHSGEIPKKITGSISVSPQALVGSGRCKGSSYDPLITYSVDDMEFRADGSLEKIKLSEQYRVGLNLLCQSGPSLNIVVKGPIKIRQQGSLESAVSAREQTLDLNGVPRTVSEGEVIFFNEEGWVTGQ